MKLLAHGLILIFSAVFLSACGQSFLTEIKKDMDVSKIDPVNKGILIFSANCNENETIKNPVFFQIQNENQDKVEIELPLGEEKIFLFEAKCGIYKVAEFRTSLSMKKDSQDRMVPKILSHEKEDDAKDYRNYEIFSQKQYFFEVKPWKINYAGNILLRNISQKKSENRIKSVYEPGYLDYFMDIKILEKTTDLEALKKNEQKLKELNFETAINLMKEENFREADLQDVRIFLNKNYFWELTIEELVQKLQSQKRQIQIIDKNTLIDNTDDKTLIEYYFETVKKDSLLKKIVLNHPLLFFGKYSGFFEKKYGKSQREGENLIWFSSDKKITLKKNKQNCNIVYESMVSR